MHAHVRTLRCRAGSTRGEAWQGAHPRSFSASGQWRQRRELESLEPAGVTRESPLRPLRATENPLEQPRAGDLLSKHRNADGACGCKPCTLGTGSILLPPAHENARVAAWLRRVSAARSPLTRRHLLFCIFHRLPPSRFNLQNSRTASVRLEFIQVCVCGPGCVQSSRNKDFRPNAPFCFFALTRAGARASR